MAKEISESATAELAMVCGSAAVAAEILGLSQRQVRQAMKAQRERRSLIERTVPGVEARLDTEGV